MKTEKNEFSLVVRASAGKSLLLVSYSFNHRDRSGLFLSAYFLF